MHLKQILKMRYYNERIVNDAELDNVSPTNAHLRMWNEKVWLGKLITHIAIIGKYCMERHHLNIFLVKILIFID